MDQDDGEEAMDEMVRRKNEMNSTKNAEANEEDQLAANNNEMEIAGGEENGGTVEGEDAAGDEEDIHNNFEPDDEEDKGDGDDLIGVIYFILRVDFFLVFYLIVC